MKSREKKPKPLSIEYTLSRLYFGMDSPTGPISHEKFQSFVDQEVTPLFPQGVTTWRSSGQYLMKNDEIVREPSMVMEILHLPDREKLSSIDSIIYQYREIFQQESVMLHQSILTSSSCSKY